MYENPLKAYQQTQKAGMTGREIEAHVLTKAALKFRECQDKWNEGGSNGMLGEAIRYNQRIWSVFQGEMVDPANPLPVKLREDILTLSRFIDKRCFDVLAFPKPEKLDILIRINLNLAAGLRGSTVEDTEEAGE
ncbi:MAG TPA: flagellar biosynthesis regulator FlaF [Syntrophales bacterium]|nr:flagellar biosynthesis regulator FlaF [Syntrophales bacterium]